MTKSRPELAVVSSLVVQFRPEQRQAIEDEINRHPHAEIHASDDHSKLVVVVEMANDIELSDFMNTLGNTPGVITVNMVFHHTEPASNNATQEVTSYA